MTSSGTMRRRALPQARDASFASSVLTLSGTMLSISASNLECCTSLGTSVHSISGGTMLSICVKPVMCGIISAHSQWDYGGSSLSHHRHCTFHLTLKSGARLGPFAFTSVALPISFPILVDPWSLLFHISDTAFPISASRLLHLLASSLPHLWLCLHHLFFEFVGSSVFSLPH